MTAFLVWTIVAGKQDKRLLFQAQALQCLEDLAHGRIDLSEHFSKPFLRIRPGFFFKGLQSGYFHAVAIRSRVPPSLIIGVRLVERQIEEKTVRAMIFNEFKGSIQDESRGIIHLL